MNLEPLFKPQTLAVIGVSLSNDRHPANVVYYKNHFRRQAKVFSVNERGGLLQGEKVYPSILDIPQRIDLAVIATRAEMVPGIMSDCIQAEAGGAVIISGGFAGMLVEEMISGIELIVGAKVDDQFGPVVLLGIGGTGVEIYKDVTLRMAPLAVKDIESMIRCLKAHSLLEGYRGSKPVNLEELNRLLKTFSDFVMDLENLIESVDLNPVICSPTRCVVADARIMLRQ